MKILHYSHLIGAICLATFALKPLYAPPIEEQWFYVSGMLFWIVVASMLVLWPKGLGLPVAILAFVAVALRFKYFWAWLATYVEETGTRVPSGFWYGYWVSEGPLALGGIFAVIAFWLSVTRNGSLNSIRLGEQVADGKTPQSP